MPTTKQDFYFPRIDDALAEYCETRNCSVEMLAELLNMSKTTLRDKRYGRGHFKVGELFRISKVTGYPVDFLIEGVKVTDVEDGE